MRKSVSQGVAGLGGDGHDRVIVQNNPVNWIDPSGLLRGGDVATVIGGLSTLATATVATIESYRTNPNTRGSTPNYKKPKGKPNQCSYKGPPPDNFDLLMILAGTPIAQFAIDFAQAQIPGGPPPNSLGGVIGAIINDLFTN